MHVVILGAMGLLGSSFARTFGSRYRVTALGRVDLDVTDSERVTTVIRESNPDVVVNAAAFMNADRCESFPEDAYLVNTVGARYVSRACAASDAVCIWFSSDFVFDGHASSPYDETAQTRPLNTYGMTKLAGEHEVRWGCGRHYIVRTAGLFGPQAHGIPGQAFVDRMLAKAHNGEALSIVDDVVMSPTYTEDLTRMVVAMVAQQVPYGLYHVTNRGHATWHELCRKACAATGVAADITAISIATRPAAVATRPRYTPLTSTRLPPEIRSLNRPWQAALREYLETTRRAPSRAG